MKEEPVVVHVFPGGWGLSSASPFCVKLETWIRMVDIPYRLEIVEAQPKSDTSPLNRRVTSDDRLIDYCDMMEDVYWSD